MKKNIMLVAMSLVVMLVLSACGSSTKTSFESNLLKMGAIVLSNFREELSSYGERTYEVTYSDGIYTADINGQNFQVKLPPSDEKKLKITEVEECTSKKKLELVNRSKALVKSYIESSKVLRDKEQLIDALDQIEVKMGVFDAPALYEDGTMYLCKKAEDAICEWMIVHELVHFIAAVTNNGIENEPYAYNKFNEAMTDIITMCMEPKLAREIMSGYAEYHENLLIYTGIFQERALEAYFYGYDSIWEQTGRIEFDFWVYSLENFYSSELAMACVNNTLLKWSRTLAE